MPPGTRTYARQPLSNNATRIAAFSAGPGAVPLALGGAWRCSECRLTSAAEPRCVMRRRFPGGLDAGGSRPVGRVGWIVLGRVDAFVIDFRAVSHIVTHHRVSACEPVP